jgi:phage terminase Nu1 subunit (DNA packaging protein)
MIVSANELCELLGVSAKSISQFSASGVVARVSHGKYDLKASIAGYVAHRIAVATAHGPSASVASVAEARVRLLKLQGDKVAREVQVAAGELVPIAQVEAAWTAIARRVRGAMLALSARLSGKLSLSREAVVVVDDEVRAALTELADDAAGALVEIEAALAKVERTGNASLASS